MLDTTSSNEWASLPLKYIAKLIVGYSFDSRLFNLYEGAPVIRIGDISSGKTEIKTTESTSDDYLVNEGDLLVAMSGDFKVRIWSTSPGLLNQRCGKLIFTDEIIKKLVFYQMPFHLKRTWDTMFSTTLKNLSNGELMNYKIQLPITKEERTRVVCNLDKISSIIEQSIHKCELLLNNLSCYKEQLKQKVVLRGLQFEKQEIVDVEWIHTKPLSWNIFRIASLYAESKESGRDGLPFLTISINDGISDRELSAEEQTRNFIRTEDVTKNKRVQPNDLAYNMMRAWQGAFGAAKVEGMISSAYVVARPKVKISSKFMEWLLRTPNAMEEIRTRSHGIADFRLRLYWDQFKNINVSIPSYEEQLEIVEATEMKLEKIDDYILKIRKHIELLYEYKQSLIYEVITGKREVKLST